MKLHSERTVIHGKGTEIVQSKAGQQIQLNWLVRTVKENGLNLQTILLMVLDSSMVHF